MDIQTLKMLLEQLRQGQIDVETALERLRQLPFESIGYANIDHHRSLRCDMPEVIFGQGKSVEQTTEIFSRLAKSGQNVLATRVDADVYDAIAKRFPKAQYHQLARAITLKQQIEPLSTSKIVIVTAGTSDICVAQEALVTAELLNQRVETIYDVGVAGLHRLLYHCGQIQEAAVVIVVAGMEGALASVVGGLVSSPVIAVPTSIGYGASFGGVAALLAMLNSCAAGVCVVNIDNGFSAGCIAAKINRLAIGD